MISVVRAPDGGSACSDVPTPASTLRANKRRLGLERVRVRVLALHGVRGFGFGFGLRSRVDQHRRLEDAAYDKSDSWTACRLLGALIAGRLRWPTGWGFDRGRGRCAWEAPATTRRGTPRRRGKTRGEGRGVGGCRDSMGLGARVAGPRLVRWAWSAHREARRLEANATFWRRGGWDTEGRVEAKFRAQVKSSDPHDFSLAKQGGRLRLLLARPHQEEVPASITCFTLCGGNYDPLFSAGFRHLPSPTRPNPRL